MGTVLGQKWLSGPWCVHSWGWGRGKAPGNQAGSWRTKGRSSAIQQPWSHALGNSATWWTHGEVSEVQVSVLSDSLRPHGL